MSLASVPRRLLDRLRGREHVSSDDPLVRRLVEVAHRLQPDPLFERRLRGEILNRHVAEREGTTTAPRARRREVGVLGRAVLYASFALAVGTTAVGASAQAAVPGDALYPVKLRIEELRIQLAPAGMRPQLVAARLDERLTELEILARRGAWSEVPGAARIVDDTALQLEAFDLGPATPGHEAVERHAQVLATLVEEAPAAAREGLARAIAASSAVAGSASVSPGTTPSDGVRPDHPSSRGGRGPSASERPH